MNEGFYSVRTSKGRVNKPRDYNRIVDMDRIRILDRLCQRKGSWTVLSLRNYVSEQNGLRPHDWDFYYILRQMEEDALLSIKYDPDFNANMAQATEYGRQRFQRLKEELREILK